MVPDSDVGAVKAKYIAPFWFQVFGNPKAIAGSGADCFEVFNGSIFITLISTLNSSIAAGVF